MLADGAADAIASGCEQARRLALLLDEEFDALRTQDLAGFEKLQEAKDQALEMLSRLVTLVARMSDDAAEPSPMAALPPWAPHWEQFQALMATCEIAHRRNDILIRSRLETIKATLQILQNGESSPPVEVYDRLGRVGRHSRGRGYEDA